MSYPLFELTNSGAVVNLEPEWGLDLGIKKMQSDLRTQAGGLIQYKWSEYSTFKIPVKYVPYATFAQVNYWYQNNTDLIFTFLGTDYNVRVVNKDAPIDKFSKPYMDLFEGTIELSEY